MLYYVYGLRLMSRRLGGFWAHPVKSYEFVAGLLSDLKMKSAILSEWYLLNFRCLNSLLSFTQVSGLSYANGSLAFVSPLRLRHKAHFSKRPMRISQFLHIIILNSVSMTKFLVHFLLVIMSTIGVGVPTLGCTNIQVGGWDFLFRLST